MEELHAGDPQQIGPYALTARLGAGGMGMVFLGQSAAGRLVAIKVIHSQLAMDTGFRTRFDREITAARKVGGFYTAPVVDADTAGPQPWLAVGYVDGPSLEDAVRENGPMPEKSLLILAAGLAEGLGAVHAAGVVHRDLKPSNVMLAPDGVRVIDFGIAQAAGDTMLTGTGLVIGSPWFMSPEQADDRAVGPASDVFSMGGVLVFAATGKGPFGSGRPAEQLYRVVHDSPRLAGLPASLRAIVAECMDKEPGRRPTAGQCLARFPKVSRGSQLRPASIDWWPAQRESESPERPAQAGRTVQSAVAGEPPSLAPSQETGLLAADPAELANAAAMSTETVPGQGEPPAPDGPTGLKDNQAGHGGRRLNWKRLRWAIPITATVLAGIAAIIVEAPPASPTGVLQPAGLAVAAATYSTVDIHWLGPPAGPLPDKYEILQDGTIVASVPGSTTSYRVTALVPATSYRFQVIAIRGGKRSPVSGAVKADTGRPPLSDAVLQWGGNAAYKIMSIDPSDPSYGKIGDTGSDPWSFSSDCPTGKCGTMLSGSLNGNPFEMSLSRDVSGAGFLGSATVAGLTACNGKTDTNDTLTIQVTVTHAASNGVAWAADQWDGELTLSSPGGTCSGVVVTYTVHST